VFLQAPFHSGSRKPSPVLDVNDAQFGRWVRGGGNGGHQSWSYRYGNLWDVYVKNHPAPDAADIIDYFGRLNGLR